MTIIKKKNNSKLIYLDNAASTPIDKEVIDEMLPFMLIIMVIHHHFTS